MKKRSPRIPSHGLVFTAVLSAGILLSGVASQAATDTWSGSINGVWDTSTLNWNSGASAFTSSDNALFTGTPTNNVTTATGLTVGTITLDNTFTGLVTLTGANTITGPITIQGGVLRFSAANQLGAAGITLDGGTFNSSISTNSTISITNVITVNSASTIQMTNTSTTGTPTFILNGAGKLTGSGTLTVKGNGGAPVYGVGATDMVLNNTNTGYTGNLILQDGAILEYNNVNSVGTGASFTVNNNGVFSANFAGTDTHAMTLNSGGTLASQNSSSIMGGAITLNGDASIRLRDWYDSTNRNLAITSTITGAHTLNVNSGGDTGTGGTLTLGGFDGKASSADLVLNGASLAINSGSGTAAASVTRANSLTINTGNFTVTGVAGQNTNDVFGTLNLGNGSSGNFQGYSTWTLSPNAATNTALTFTNMGTRTAGSWVALASTVGATPAANTANIYFTNGLSGSNLIGSGGTLSSGTASVIPWLHDTGGGTIYGYDATVGVAAITTLATANLNTATSDQNVFLSLSNGSTHTLTGNKTVNSLQTAFNNINMGGNTLTVSSGVITSDNATFSNGTLDFGSAEGQIQVHQARQLNIDAVITGSGGATFYGFRTNSGNKGTAILNGANTYTGVTNMYGYGAGNNFVLYLTNSLALQNSTLNYVAGRASNISFGNGGTTGQTAYTFGGLSGNLDINLNNNNTTVGAVALTVGGNNDSTTYSGILSSTVAGGSLTKTGTGTFTLSGVNTYTGATTINNGTLKLGIANALATGTSITLGGGTLNLGGFSQAAFTNALTMTAGSTIDFGTHVTGLTLKFGDSQSAGWTGNLTLLNFTVGTDNLNFTSIAGGLTSTQLSQINLAGYTATGFDGTGNVQFTVSSVPEPATYALVASLGVFAVAAYRRRRRNT
jgi:fibronectin-binding autotransporter adhesin